MPLRLSTQTSISDTAQQSVTQAALFPRRAVRQRQTKGGEEKSCRIH
jgi:hypothetical protein